MLEGLQEETFAGEEVIIVVEEAAVLVEETDVVEEEEEDVAAAEVVEEGEGEEAQIVGIYAPYLLPSLMKWGWVSFLLAIPTSRTLK